MLRWWRFTGQLVNLLQMDKIFGVCFHCCICFLYVCKEKDVVLEWECDFQPGFFFFLPSINFSSFKCSWWEAKGIWAFKFGTGFVQELKCENFTLKLTELYSSFSNSLTWLELLRWRTHLTCHWFFPFLLRFPIECDS